LKNNGQNYLKKTVKKYLKNTSKKYLKNNGQNYLKNNGQKIFEKITIKLNLNFSFGKNALQFKFKPILNQQPW